MSALLLVTWVFLFLLELFGPGINSSKVLINMGTTNGILPSIGAGMTESLDTTVEAWLEPWVEDPANATYCNHWSDCDCSQECWPIPPEITPSGHHAGICLCKSGNLMEGDSCDIASDPAAVRTHVHESKRSSWWWCRRHECSKSGRSCSCCGQAVLIEQRFMFMRAQAWAWVFFLGTIVVAAFMAKDVINVMLALPKLRGTKQ